MINYTTISFFLSLTFLNTGWSNASSIDILFLGLNTNVFYKKSIASGLDPGYNSQRLVDFLCTNDFKYSNALASVIKSKSPLVSSGVPII